MRSGLTRMLPGALAAGSLAFLSIVGTASAAGSENGHSQRIYVATLTGAAEVPGPGEEEGAGSAWISVDEGARKICWVLAQSGLSEPNAAHIHIGSADIAGPVVVPLNVPTEGTSAGCTEGIDRTLIRSIMNNPTDYYVNIHTDEYPGGAIRGQLNFPH